MFLQSEWHILLFSCGFDFRCHIFQSSFKKTSKIFKMLYIFDSTSRIDSLHLASWDFCFLNDNYSLFLLIIGYSFFLLYFSTLSTDFTSTLSCPSIDLTISISLYLLVLSKSAKGTSLLCFFVCFFFDAALSRISDFLAFVQKHLFCFICRPTKAIFLYPVSFRVIFF